jgi:hypothetical protein
MTQALFAHFEAVASRCSTGRSLRAQTREHLGDAADNGTAIAAVRDGDHRAVPTAAKSLSKKLLRRCILSEQACEQAKTFRKRCGARG